MNPTWFAPLALGAVGAVVLSIAARRVARDVADLQQALRPVRVRRDRPTSDR